MPKKAENTGKCEWKFLKLSKAPNGKYANKFEVRWANWEIINLEYRQEVSEYFLILQNIQDKLLSHT